MDFYIFKSGKKAIFCKDHKEYYYRSRQEKSRQTCIEKYGVENPSQSNIIKEKKRKTNQKNWGVDNVFQSENIQQKSKQTLLEKYGVEHPAQNACIREKQKQTTLKLYGVEYASQNAEIQNKVKQTNLKRYGVEYYLQTEEKKERTKHTSIKKYGTNHPLQNEDILKKQKQTNLEKYGSEYPNQNKNIRYKIQQAKKIKYWDIFIIKLKAKQLIPIFNKEYYINNTTNFTFKCLRCNNEFNFEHTDVQHIYCECNKSTSLPEYEIEEWLKSLNANLEIKRNVWIHFNTKEVKRREIDIAINNKIAIFYHGIYWHSDIYRDKNYHQELFNLFIEKGYDPIQIFENEWLSKQEIVKSIILSKLNINQTKIYARNTIIKEITISEYKIFLEINHIQGYANSKIKLGMFYNDKLISVLGMGKSRFKNNETEIIRYCSLLNYQITGGLAKFLAYIKNNYQFENIISYIDLRYFDGSSYIKNGFMLDSITYPNYYYFYNNNNNFTLYNRIQFQKHKLKDKLEIFDEKLSEYENMLNNGYLRIFDAGNYKLRLKGI